MLRWAPAPQSAAWRSSVFPEKDCAADRKETDFPHRIRGRRSSSSRKEPVTSPYPAWFFDPDFWLPSPLQRTGSGSCLRERQEGLATERSVVPQARLLLQGVVLPPLGGSLCPSATAKPEARRGGAARCWLSPQAVRQSPPHPVLLPQRCHPPCRHRQARWEKVSLHGSNLPSSPASSKKLQRFRP